MFRDLLAAQPNTSKYIKPNQFFKRALILECFIIIVSLSLCHDLKDLVQEFYRLELVVMTDERNSNEIPAAAQSPDLNNKAKETAASHLTNSQQAGITSPSAFFNHHANRFKSKLIPQSSTNNTNNTNGTNVLGTTYKQTSSTWNSLKNNLIILANAAAIELYFLVVEDEQDAEKLCTKCSEKFFINLSLTDSILQAPLIASCVQVLGRLALKYPNLSKISVRYLTDFLTEPSPILLKQYKHIIEKLNFSKNPDQTAAKASQNNGVLSSNSMRQPNGSEFQANHTKNL
jgi:hypothetical protein